MKLAFSLCLTVSVLTLAVNNCAVASPLDTSHIHTQHTLGLKPISSLEDSYNLAAAVFLPDFEDSVGFGGNTLDDDVARRDNCAGFALSSCPAHAKCSKCTFDTKYKITSCDTNYKLSGNACIAKTCSEINSGYKADVPTNQICTITNTSVRTCYSSCRTVNTSGYPLDTCPSGAKCTTAPDCTTSATSKGNCSPVKQKVTGCTSSTQKVNSTATACIDKDDTCPTNYYKSCETGTQGDPKYTERGSACYQCKPDDGCSPKFKYTISDCQQLYGKDYTATGDHGWCYGKFEECRKVAKVLYGDGNIASVAELYDNKDKTPIGIIFDETNRLAISITNITEANSLEDKKVQWSTSLPTSLTKNLCITTSGRENTDILLNTKEGGPYEAAETVNKYEPNGCDKPFCRRGQWFLPSWEEWVKIKENHSQISEAVSKLYEYINRDTWNKAQKDINGYITEGYHLYTFIWLSQDDIKYYNGQWNYRARTANSNTSDLYESVPMITTAGIRPIIKY